jgi:hypothetical protein
MYMHGTGVMLNAGTTGIALSTLVRKATYLPLTAL